MTAQLRGKLIGDRAFYRQVVSIVLPIIIQMSVTNIVNLLDNIMVGQLGTAELSGVAIGNQLIFVFNLCIFGGLSGPGIFGAQYFGAEDMEGVRNTFRMKLWISFVLIASAFVVIFAAGPQLVSAYLTGEGDPALARDMLRHSMSYIHIMMIGFIPFALTTSYAGTLRESGETLLPMKAGITAVLTNLVGNWLLIYGNLGFPMLGVRGAAIATVISRFVELFIVLRGSHSTGRYAFLSNIYHKFSVPWPVAKAILKKGMPLLLNEFLWSMGMATLSQIYSVRGLHVLAAYNIANAVNGLFNVFFLSMGNAIAVMIGQSLGANKMDRARRDVWRLMFLSFSVCVFFGSVMGILSPYFPLLYNTGPDARHLASGLILTMACFMPTYAISHACYFTLRSGGSTLMTFLFDSAFMWLVNIALAYVLAHYTKVPIHILFPLCEAAGLIKVFLGLYLVKRGVWVRNIVHRPA